ncbi:hypothetical protein BOX15_Mlig023018g1, partial [Macrostomum lignano]
QEAQPDCNRQLQATLACPLCWLPQSSQQELASHLVEHRQLMLMQPNPAVSLQLHVPPTPNSASANWQCELCSETCPTDWELMEHLVVCHSDCPDVTRGQLREDLSFSLESGAAVQSSRPQQCSNQSESPQSQRRPPNLSAPISKDRKVTNVLKNFLKMRRRNTAESELRQRQQQQQQFDRSGSNSPQPNQLKPYKCFLCDRELPTADCLDRHLLRQHAGSNSESFASTNRNDSELEEDSGQECRVAAAQTGANQEARHELSCKPADCSGNPPSGLTPAAAQTGANQEARHELSCTRKQQSKVIIVEAVSCTAKYSCFLCANTRFTSADQLDQHLLERHAVADEDFNGKAAAAATAAAEISNASAAPPLKRRLTNATEQDSGGDSGVSSDGVAEKGPVDRSGCGGSVSGSSSHADDAGVSQEGPAQPQSVQQQQQPVVEKRPKQLRCPICCKNFDSQLLLNNHTYRTHLMLKRARGPGDKLPCPICPMAYDNVDDLSLHMISHSS